MQALQLNKVVKRYGDKTAVNGIDFNVRQGEIYGLLGANGAGKTTTMRMVLGLILPDDGQILWNGKPYHAELRSLMGYLPEERGLYPKLKINEQLIYLAELRGMKRKDADTELKAWLERFEIPEYYTKKIEELSKGNQQKIQFIAAVLHRPQILILDEAFSGLDPVNVELLKSMVHRLKAEGITILFSSHRMDHVEELCEKISVLHRSETVLQGTIKEIKRRFPRETVVLETEGNVSGLSEIGGISKIDGKAGNYKISITDLTAAQAVLKLASSQTVVNRFQIMEPTLNEIFIRTVGGRNE